MIGVQHLLSDMCFLKESNTDDIIMLWLLIVTQNPWVIMSNAWLSWSHRSVQLFYFASQLEGAV